MKDLLTTTHLQNPKLYYGYKVPEYVYVKTYTLPVLNAMGELVEYKTIDAPYHYSHKKNVPDIILDSWPALLEEMGRRL